MTPEEQLERILASLVARPEVLEAYVFGSYARGDARAHSDLDIAVFVATKPDGAFGYAAELTTDVMAAARRNDVDVVILNDAPPMLYHRVLRDGRRLFARDLVATTGREGRALSRYCDYLSQLKKIDAVAAARTRRGALGR